VNYEQAHRILDRYKDGEQFSSFTINQALYLTGDLGIYERERSTGVALQIQEETKRAWIKHGSAMVEQNNLRD